MRKASNIENHSWNVYMQTYWNSRHKENAILGKKYTHALHQAAIAKAHKQYDIDHRLPHHAIHYFANCIRSFSKILIKRRAQKSQAKPTKKQIKRITKITKPKVSKPTNVRPIKVKLSKKTKITRPKLIRPKLTRLGQKEWRWTKWNKFTVESKLWRDVDFKSVIFIKNISVEDYAGTVKENISKFSQVDQSLINMCH